jgi:hypothetical protein
MSQAPIPEWESLGSTSPDALADTRLELHWAAQIIGAVPLALLDAVPDFSHANLGWLPATGAHVTRPIGDTSPVRVGLRFGDFSVVLFDDHESVLDEVALTGRTLEEGYAWVAGALTRHDVGAVDPEELHRPDADFPDHALRSGAAFTGGAGTARRELARWFGNALLVLSEVAVGNDGAAPVRTWPHHLDIATLITPDATADPEKAKSVGVGMTPGDASYDEPYFYVTPWPYPKTPALTPLDGEGIWHTEGWVGAVLTGSRLVAGGADADAQATRARAFLASAIPAARAMAGA